MSGSNGFSLTPKRWIENTNAITQMKSLLNSNTLQKRLK